MPNHNNIAENDGAAPPASDAQLILIPERLVAETWSVAVPFLERAAAASGMLNVDDWRAACVTADKQLWLAWSEDELRCYGAGVSYLTQTPGGKVCVIDGFSAVDGHRLWKRSLPVLEAWAISQGCTRVRVYGRVGWGRHLPQYACKGVVLERWLSTIN